MNDQNKMVADALKGSWVHRFLPESLWPFAQLARWERPIGWKLLMWPCWWSLMLAIAYLNSAAAGLVGEGSPLLEIVWRILTNEFLLPYLVLFFLGAFVMRGAGCTYNDLVDQDIDEKVARTRSRPLPSGRVTRKQATIFLVLQMLVGLVILLQFNFTTIIVGLVSVITILVYPFMKRITWWPQLFLGLAFSWGAWVGWTSVMANGWSTGLGTYFQFPQMFFPPAMLYLGSICWVIAYDTIYAYQDIEDDALVGVKSTARLFAEKTKTALVLLYGAAVVLFGLSFYLTGVSWPAWIGLGLGAMHLAWQVNSFSSHDPANSLRLFKSNSGFGWLLFLGLFASVLAN